MRIKHNLALLNVSVFLEEAGDFVLRELGVNAGNEQVGTWVHCAIVLGRATIVLWRTTTSCQRAKKYVKRLNTDRLSM
jgi:hypothetical protein